jgi:hypothetical protein
MVKLLASRGIPQEEIRQLIRNPQTGKPLSIKTLERAFATEIRIAKSELDFKVGTFIVNSILGRTPAHVKPRKDDRERVRWAIFYALSTVASAGTIIYLAGEKRIAAPNAFFRFHHVTQNFSKPPTSMTLDEFTDEKTSLAMSLERLEQIYRERTSLKSEQIEEFRQHAVFFDAAAAHNAGIVHEVAALRIPPGAAMTVVNTVPTETPR